MKLPTNEIFDELYSSFLNKEDPVTRTDLLKKLQDDFQDILFVNSILSITQVIESKLPDVLRAYEKTYKKLDKDLSLVLAQQEQQNHKIIIISLHHDKLTLTSTEIKQLKNEIAQLQKNFDQHNNKFNVTWIELDTSKSDFGIHQACENILEKILNKSQKSHYQKIRLERFLNNTEEKKKAVGNKI